MNNHKRKREVVFKCIHLILARHCLPDGTLERQKLFSVMAERIGKAVVENKTDLILQLKREGIIIDESKSEFKIKQLPYPIE